MKNLRTFELFESIESFDSSRVFLHGTKRTFSKFKVGSEVSNRTYGEGAVDNDLGIFFTDNKIMAEYFAGLTYFDPEKSRYIHTKSKGGHIVKVNLNLKNPYIIDENSKGYDVDNDGDSVQMYFKEIKKAGGVNPYRNKLKKAGYDGIWLKGCNTNYYADDTYEVVVAFSPEQINIVK